MAENKNSFIKSKMNKDLDDRLIPNNEYRDANNIAVSRSENQDVGALEAILGNEAVFSSAGSLETIGNYVDQAGGFIYYFLTDFSGTLSQDIATTNTCQICRWSPSSGSNTPDVLVEGHFLNFSTQAPIHGVNLLENLLFWTDNRNQPRVINVQTASPSGSGKTYYTDEADITVCKYSPYEAPRLVDLRSVSSTLPSTMSDETAVPTILIDALNWATVNLNVTRYRNGDLIEHATTWADWVNANTRQVGAWCYYSNDYDNGAIYGKLYNKWAVEDSRNLAPYGYTLATEANYTALTTYTTAGGRTVADIKSTAYWTATSLITNNSLGFNALPSGERIATSDVADFQNINTHGEFWIKGVDKYYQILDSGSAPTNQTSSSNLQGRAVRVIKDSGFKGWQGDPELMKDKFIRFSYRFKYNDGEYSLIAPFTQECFVPQQEGKFVNEDEDDTMTSTIVEFMQNNINNVILNIELPSLDIINDYKIQEIDIIYKESDSLTYRVLQSVPVDTTFISNLNNTNVYQYTYQSTIPYKTLPTDETTRVYDKVPVRALSQEIAGNRVMYGNFIQGYNAPLGLDYAVNKKDKDNQEYEEYPQHSVKENRNYQVGVILADKWGRQTDVILSSKDNVLVAGGEPTEGSNYFSNYRPVENASTLSGWQGEQLSVRFDSAINVNGNNAGLYAVPEQYTVAVPSGAPYSYFKNYSTQILDTTGSRITTLAVANVTTNTSDGTNGDYSGTPGTTTGWTTSSSAGSGASFEITITGNAVTSVTLATAGTGYIAGDTFTIAAGTVIGGSTNVVLTLFTGSLTADLGYFFGSINYTDTQAAANTFNLYSNDGSGWVVIAPATYTAAASSTPTDPTNGRLKVTLNTALPLNQQIKAELKYNTDTTSGEYYYTLSYIPTTGDAAADLITSKDLFAVGKELRGKYQDYVKIERQTDPSLNNILNIYTYEEIADSYMFLTLASTVYPEPVIADDYTNYVYAINEMGFYSYRLVVKQQQQEFYNVYLPGIIDGYPIGNNTTEVGSTAFMVLTHDNINKVPRQLKNVSNQDTQFNSDLMCWGRVTNEETTPGNAQYSPNINPDGVELIGGIKDVFPDITYDAAPTGSDNKLNTNAIYDVDSKPFIAKVNTQKSIGLIQTSFNTVAVAGRPDYPAYMRLSVYETAPVVSQLDLFWETSTSGLISDLNYAVTSEGTRITGISSFTWLFNEGDAGNTQITTTFWPVTPQGNDTTSTASVVETLIHDSDGQPALPSISLFNIVSAGGGGFYLQLKVGAERACLINFEYLEKYQIKIEFTQNDGNVSYQTITRTLINDKPICDLSLAPAPEIADKEILNYAGYTPPGGLSPGPGNGPGVLKGYNGSANPCQRTQDIQWSIESFRYQNTLGVWGDYITGQNPTGEPTSTDIDYYMLIQEQTAQNQTTCTTGSNTNFYGVKVNRNLSTYNSQYEATLQELIMKLTDLNSTGDSETIAVQWTPKAARYTGVRINFYNNNPAATANEFNGPAVNMYAGCDTQYSTPVLPTWVGEIGNWEYNAGVPINIYVKIGNVFRPGDSTVTALSSFQVTWNGENTQNSNSPAKGDGTAALGAAVNMSYSGTTTTWQLIGTLQPFNPTPQQITDGVVPGDKGTDSIGAAYDFGNCVWINNKIAFTSLNTCDGGAGIEIYYDVNAATPAAPVDPKPVQPATGSPPFVTDWWYKTSGWPGA